MNKQIMQHITLYEKINKAGFPWSVLGYGSRHEVVQVCDMVIEHQIQSAVSQMSNKMIQYLFIDKNFIEVVHQLLKDEICLREIMELISAADNELLSRYDYISLKTVLSDCTIKSDVRFWYMKYYNQYSLSQEQKQNLNTGLSFFKIQTEVELDDLDEQERKIFWEPIWSSNLLKHVVKSKEDIQELLKPEFLSLLYDVNKNVSTWYQLKRGQWDQLRKESRVIKKGLKEVLLQLYSQDISHFLSLWLENESLRYDIDKIKNELPNKSKEELHQMTRSNASYINMIYGGSIDGIPLEGLAKEKEKLLIYAITNRKNHFLSLVREHFDVFWSLPKSSLLLDPDVYQQYLNINTMNERDFHSCFSLNRMDKNQKQLMVNSSYVFTELAILSGVSSDYVKLFHKLRYRRSDDRLRVFRELVKKRCLPAFMNAEELESLGNTLSQKALSQWMQDEFAHIKGVSSEDAVRVLSHWERIRRFVPELEDGVQVRYLLRNEKMFDKYEGFSKLHEQLIETDRFWKEIQEELQITDEFVTENKENLYSFLYEGGAEVIHAILHQQPDKKEIIRRIMVAELLGRFNELKYHKGDLQKEIDFPVTEEVERAWQENLELMENGIRIWEEDRMLPTMRIGEIPTHTCLSYKNGVHNECLLSCFDSNKKVMQAYVDGRIVFRAIVRFTKGTFVHIPDETPDVEFVDLTQQPKKSGKEKGSEEFVLFLECPYFKWISEKKENEIVTMLCQLLQKKAKKLGARLIISSSYNGYSMSNNNFALVGYSIYISNSKNGCQYLDSLGGKASVSDSRSYGRNRFWIANIEEGSKEVA